MLRILHEFCITLIAWVAVVALIALPILIVSAIFGNPAGRPGAMTGATFCTVIFMMLEAWIVRKVHKTAKALREQREQREQTIKDGR